MSERRAPLLSVVDLLQVDHEGPEGPGTTLVLLPNVSDGPLRDLLEAAAGPARPHELDGEAAVRASFAQASSGWRRRAHRKSRRVAVIGFGAALSLAGASTGLAAAQVPNPIAKVVGGLLGAPTAPPPTSRLAIDSPGTTAGSVATSAGKPLPTGCRGAGVPGSCAGSKGTPSPTAARSGPAHSAAVPSSTAPVGTSASSTASTSGAGSSPAGSGGHHHPAGGSGGRSGSGSNRGGFQGSGGCGSGSTTTTTTTSTTTTTTSTSTTTTTTTVPVLGGQVASNCGGHTHQSGSTTTTTS